MNLVVEPRTLVWAVRRSSPLSHTSYSNLLLFYKLKCAAYLISGDLERLRRYWMTGSCKPGKEQHKTSDPLALEQFLSAFLLLMTGILIATTLLLLEHLYFKYIRKHLAKTDKGGCCALVSLVSIFKFLFNKFYTIFLNRNSFYNSFWIILFTMIFSCYLIKMSSSYLYYSFFIN